jgi:hypothetical protein
MTTPLPLPPLPRMLLTAAPVPCVAGVASAPFDRRRCTSAVVTVAAAQPPQCVCFIFRFWRVVRFSAVLFVLGRFLLVLVYARLILFDFCALGLCLCFGRAELSRCRFICRYNRLHEGACARDHVLIYILMFVANSRRGINKIFHSQVILHKGRAGATVIGS